ncbi:potassium channel family protein [Methanolobus sp. WCC4]|uniref:potassium channel family protein n=1 Tax=Methanolobus sp. WCC4 TaxID=3125784 RepID=UPI0030F688E1
MNEILKRIIGKSCFKIGIFMIIILFITVLTGILMYIIEGKNGGFNTIPLSIYWASSTLLTVGYGDIVPQTGFGRIIAILLQTLGYSILFVPVVIVVYEIVNTFLNLFSGTVNDNP